MPLHAAALRIELRLPEVQSLKGKRAVLRPVIEGMRKLASVSVAEVDRHDAWQRATIGVALVAPDARHLDRLVAELRRYLDQCTEIEVVEIGLSHLEDPV